MKGLHAALGRWYWFVLGTLFFITLHTIDHVTAVFTDHSFIGDTVIGEQNAEGFVLWHGGLTTADYAMTILLLTLVYTRFQARSQTGPGGRIQQYSVPTALSMSQNTLTYIPRLVLGKPINILKNLHLALGLWYWFIAGSLIFVSIHTFDHIIAIIYNTSPLSDTIVANSISHTGFLIWHSVLTLVDYSVTVILLHLLYTRWQAIQHLL